MVELKAVYLITDEGFTIYHQSFGETEQDLDIIGYYLMVLRSPDRVAGGDNSLPKVDFGEGADMILESGKRIIAIAVVVLDKKQEEYTMRNDLAKFVKKVEEMYAEELDDPIFQKSAFSEVGRLVQEHFASYL